VPAKKCWDKNRRKKLRKKGFYIHTNIVTKKLWKKRATQCFQKHTNSAGKKCCEKIIVKKCEIVRAKNDWKKTPQKIPKNRFLYSHEYRDQKWGGKKARNNFSRNTTNSAIK